MSKLIHHFRIVGFIEGTSLLVLLFIAIPAKYYWGYPAVMPVVGWSHGVLFLIFLISALIVSHKKQWSMGFFFLVFLSAFIPFGTFIMDRKIKTL
jgi:integral membrane protein